MKNKNINNSTKNNTSSNTSTKNNRNSKLDSINNNMKPTTSAKRSVPTTNVTRTNTRVPSRTASSVARTSPIVDSPISTDRSKTYIVLVWQSRSAGIIRRIMEVPGTQLTRTLDDIRMQKKAFSFYEKR